MTTTSATGGPLLALAPLPLDDAALDAVFQQLVADVTGLTGQYVRPRWQTSVPKQPEPGVNWCAIGVIEVEQDNGPWIVYDPLNNNQNYWDHEVVHVLASFYGPNCQGFARQLRNGLDVPQNTEELLPYAIRYLDCGMVRAVPELVNEQWIRRQDLTLMFRRKVIATYAIQNLLSAGIDLTDDTVVVDWIEVPQGVLPLQGTPTLDSNGNFVLDSKGNQVTGSWGR